MTTSYKSKFTSSVKSYYLNRSTTSDLQRIPKKPTSKDRRITQNNVLDDSPPSDTNNLIRPSAQELSSGLPMTLICWLVIIRRRVSKHAFPKQKRAVFGENQPYSPIFTESLLILTHISQRRAVRRNSCEHFTKQILTKQIHHSAS